MERQCRMANIHVLEKQIAELIAAGEVVDRPASVVKELVENSIDAGASALTVEIQRGGVTFLRVTDNGWGILREEVPVAFLRHATSKINKQDDLDQIGTLGFRGEALASIAAVSEVEIFTRTQEELAGTHYMISGGEEQLLEEAGCAQGTTFVVRNLFYNTPARMKFLKTDATESRAVAAVLDNIALSHPEVSVRFIRDGKEELHTPGDGKLKSAVYSVFGKEFTSGLISVNYQLDGVKVYGFISKPAMARPNRSMQQFFINGRCVKSRTAMVALEQAFKGALMVGKFPACILHLELSFQAVDVNVHPSKLEVRFLNERPIFDAIYHGVKTALNQGDTPSILNFSSEKKKPDSATKTLETSVKPSKLPPPKQEPIASQSVSAFNVPSKPISHPDFAPKKEKIPLPSVYSDVSNHVHSPAMLRDSVKPNHFPNKSSLRSNNSTKTSQNMDDNSYLKEFKQNGFLEKAEEILETEPSEVLAQAQFQSDEIHLLGEAFGTYILVEQNQDELLFIDKHAAHERMLYEKLKEERQDFSAQLLLEPVTVTLNKNEYASVLGALEIFAQAGFDLEDFGGGTILVRSAPLFLEKGDVAEAVMEMAGYLHSAKTDLTTEHLDWLYHNIACRAAIKAGDDSNPQELVALARRLREHPEIRYCPHGRPVSIVMKRQDLEKQFGRI